MGFGQHTKADHGVRATGYPVPRPDVKVGRMTKAEIMESADLACVIDAKISAHNEVTIRYTGGSLVCRLRETNVVEIGPNAVVLIDTGGWNTITTRRHIRNFLKRQGWQISLWGDKRKGGNVLTLYGIFNHERIEIVFKQRAMFNMTGGFISDLEDDDFGFMLQGDIRRLDQ